MTDFSTWDQAPFSVFEFGEWEAIGDRITRRKLTHKRTHEWRWQYQIQRDYEGQAFAAMFDILPEFISAFSAEQFHAFVRERFLMALVSSAPNLEFTP